ncbi:MAG: metallophosphoesterase [Enterococcus sp.]
MRTLLVGDLHLKAQIILPMVETKMKKLKCQRVILLGDYMDAAEQATNLALYMEELDYLLAWKRRQQARGIEVITLLGNHEAPYLTFTPRSYSLQGAKGFIHVHRKLLKLGVQVAFQLGQYLVSHAGYTQDYKLRSWHLTPVTESTIKKIAWLDERTGRARGGRYRLGSPIWADFSRELCRYPNLKYPKQIVGHTPQLQIKPVKKAGCECVGIDTLKVSPEKSRPYLKQKGNGEILLYDAGKLTPIALDWNRVAVKKQIAAKFEFG